MKKKTNKITTSDIKKENVTIKKLEDVPFKTAKNEPIMFDGKTSYFNHTGIPRRNANGDIIGIVCISSEVLSEAS